MGLFSFFIKGVSVALVVKLFGLLRDGLTFYFIGVNSEFDLYVYYLTFPAIITAFLLPLINLWLVPILSKSRLSCRDKYFKFFLLLSIFLACLNILISLFFSYLLKDINIVTLVLIATSTVVLILTILSEVSASQIIANGNHLQKMYLSNLFVNVPVVIYLILPNVSVLGLAIVSSFSFVLRFTYLTKYSEVKLTHILKAKGFLNVLSEIKSIKFIDIKKMLLGPLFQSSVYLGRFFCGFLPEGALSIYFYSFKLFDAFKGTLLFVGLTKFFSIIQKEKTYQSLMLFSKFSLINILVSIIYFSLLLILYYLVTPIFINYEVVSEFREILFMSFITVPLCFLYPGLVFYQRLIVSFSEVNFRFSIFFLLPIITGMLFLFLLYTEMLSVNFIIMSISLALIIPNIYIHYVIKNQLKFCKEQ